jgi:hypothetical protein
MGFFGSYDDMPGLGGFNPNIGIGGRSMPLQLTAAPLAVGGGDGGFSMPAGAGLAQPDFNQQYFNGNYNMGLHGGSNMMSPASNHYRGSNEVDDITLNPPRFRNPSTSSPTRVQNTSPTSSHQDTISPVDSDNSTPVNPFHGVALQTLSGVQNQMAGDTNTAVPTGPLVMGVEMETDSSPYNTQPSSTNTSFSNACPQLPGDMAQMNEGQPGFTDTFSAEPHGLKGMLNERARYEACNGPILPSMHDAPPEITPPDDDYFVSPTSDTLDDDFLKSIDADAFEEYMRSF